MKTQLNDSLNYNNNGLTLYNQEKYEEAIVQFKKATEIQPDYVYAYYNWGLALCELKQYPEAITQFKRATEVQPDYVYAYNDWGLALHELKQYPETITQFKRATEVQPDYVYAYYNWGLALSDLRKYEEAIVQYQNAIKFKQDFVYAYHNLAYTLEKQGKYQEAYTQWNNACNGYERTLQKALEDNDADFLFYYGNILYEVFGKLTNAESIFLQGLTLDSEHIDILSRSIDLYSEWHEEPSNEWDDQEIASVYWKARECYAKAVTILEAKIKNCDSPPNRFRLGALLLKMEEYDEAEKYFLDIIKENKELVSEAHANLGVLYTRPEKENFRLAAQNFEKARKLDPDDLTIWSNLAEVYLKLNLIEKAETEYKKIIRRSKGHVDTNIGLGELYIALAKNQDEDQYKQAIQYFTNSVRLANSPKGSKRLRKKELAAVYYSRGYARNQLYEYERLLGDNGLLIDALADFKECARLDPDHHKSKLAIEKIEASLNKTRHQLWFSEKIGSWLVIIPSAFIFLLSQISLFLPDPPW